jgi:phosphoribosylanthranilate isomerase
MPVEVKVCGLTDAAALAAAAEGGARYLGFVFYPPSPRALTPVKAAALAATAPARCAKVGVLVDPDDALIDEILAAVPLDYLQLHGAETPERVARIKARTGCAVIKALKIADVADLLPIPSFEAVADLLLFDAKPPRAPGRLPGGNGLSFDWRVLQGLEVGRPWLLSGGLWPTTSPPRCACARPARSTCPRASSGDPGTRIPPRSGASSRSRPASTRRHPFR